MSTVVLRLFTGPHMGAELVLEPGEYVLGSSLDCDIILHDSSVAPRHLKLLVEGNPASIRAIPLEGKALIAGELLDANAELLPRTPCFVGLTCLAWASTPVGEAETDNSTDNPAGSASGNASDISEGPTLPDMRAAWDEVGAALRPILNPASAQEPAAPEPLPEKTAERIAGESETAEGETVDDALPEGIEETGSPSTANNILKIDGSTANNAVLNRLPTLSAYRSGKCRVWRVVALVLLLLALSGLVFRTHDELNRPGQHVEMIQSILKEAGFPTLEVTVGDSGPLVSGRLPDDAERGRLVRLVQGLHYPVYLDVQVEQDLMQGLAAAFYSRELYPQVWAERDDNGIRLHISGYMKDGVVEAWALAGAREDLPWLGPFLDEGTEPSPGTLIRSILHADDVELVLRPALDAARLEKVRVNYLPGTIDISAVFDVEARSRLDRVLADVRERLGVPLEFQIREEHPQLSQPVAGKTTGLHPDKPAAMQAQEQGDGLAPAAAQRSPSAFRVTGVTMTPMRFITLESGERIFEGGILPGGHTLESISQTQLGLRRDGHTSTLTLRGSSE